ncbi:cysteine peptidase family C39 domain-containing protein [Streptomyces sp. NPDC014894]|uniref:cysteine peptidase family C39 domain-containing protein n=1 Tax=Streptomyces sp. NPDC014894 TaxID=3364931 RepID=UPI0036FCDAC3
MPAAVRRRTRTPRVQQMEATECGPASLAIVLGHYGRHVPLEELRIACGVSRDGATAAALVKAARSYGMNAQGRSLEPDRLAALRSPAIVYWQFNHFLVVERFGHRFGRRLVHLNDPAFGRRKVSAEEFDENFTGLALTMSPGDGFVRAGRRPGPFAGVRGRLAGAVPLMWLILLCGVLAALTGVALPALTRGFIDLTLPHGDLPRTLLLALVTATVLTVAVTALRQALVLRVRLIVATRSSARFLRHLLRLPAAFHGRRGTADLTRRMTSHDTVASVLSTDITNLAVNGLTAAVYLALLATYDTWLTGVTVALSLVNLAAARRAARARADGANRLAEDETRLFTTTVNSLQLIEVLKATGGEAENFRRWTSALATVVTSRQRVDAVSSLLMAVAPTVAAVNGALVLLVGGVQAVHGQLTVGALVAFQIFVTGFGVPLAQLTASTARIQDFGVLVTRLRDVEDVPAEPEPPSEGHGTPRELTGHLVLDRVSFGYNPTRPPLLREVSLTVRPGRQIALVGPSGSGKSTVARLVLGLHRPWSGAVTLDGRPRADVPREALTSGVAFVEQDVVLFEASLRDNITLWDPSVPDEDVMAALRDAAVLDAVLARPGGLRCRVAEDGRNFSGGERQRLELARALVRHPRLLVLDEATSALDAETEAVITDRLRRRGCAIVVIAHRLSTVRDSDEIIVFDGGRVRERGTHGELLAADGLYSRLAEEG